LISCLKLVIFLTYFCIEIAGLFRSSSLSEEWNLKK
jgi:hypothetical protein